MGITVGIWENLQGLVCQNEKAQLSENRSTGILLWVWCTYAYQHWPYWHPVVCNPIPASQRRLCLLPGLDPFLPRGSIGLPSQVF